MALTKDTQFYQKSGTDCGFELKDRRKFSYFQVGSPHELSNPMGVIVGGISYSGTTPTVGNGDPTSFRFDEYGQLKTTTTGGASSINAEYISPVDFTATYTTATTITLTGLPFTIASGMQVVYIKIRNSSTNVSTIYVHGASGYGFGHSGGIITAYLNGTVASIFTANDMYEVGVNEQKKAYDRGLDVLKQAEQSPLNTLYINESLLDTTNIAAATNYYPSATYMSMDGEKDTSLTGKFIDADGTMTMTIEVTNDEDTTNADPIQVYAYDVKNNVVANSWAVTSGTLTFAISLDELNFRYFRIKMVNDGATNTGIIKLRRKAL